ncbi:polysaccharide lyase family 7 protein [Fulvivirga ulvae]|uniref:polysaccharide lyase family 7 protein n=1 Tax=Fulvivirga ulvae TaxID=2904245 RepID=UPI001F389418|nr:polysaccharide lyase family 7 protein [Fulvivirga ulvae]UII31619.1 polysaccharide lyase family 7 protein [Fulvivirga ulvae]
MKITRIFFLMVLTTAIISCNTKHNKEDANIREDTNLSEESQMLYPSDVISFFNHWNLILGDGANVGQAVDFEHKQFFYTINEGDQNWVVYKAPNAGGTHGTSHNTRTELAQLKKWSPMTEAKLSATLKVMNVSVSGDDSKKSAHSVVVGQIHSADGHENEPLKIFYKKYSDHTKGSVFWNYEINTAGDDNSGRWDFSTIVWGDIEVADPESNYFPEEPENGIELGEEFSYEVEVKDGIMHLTFTSKGHETKKFTKNLITSEYTNADDIPDGEKGVERENAYADEGLFFKQGSYNQTNEKANGAETFGGDIQKQYETGNYTEVRFKEASIYVSEDAVSNEGYFIKNDDL